MDEVQVNWKQLRPESCIFCGRPGLELRIPLDVDGADEEPYVTHVCDTHWDAIWAIGLLAVQSSTLRLARKYANEDAAGRVQPTAVPANPAFVDTARLSAKLVLCANIIPMSELRTLIEESAYVPTEKNP